MYDGGITDSNKKINDMAEALAAVALKHGEDNNLSANEMINAMVVTTVIIAFALRKDDANLARLKASLVDAVAESFDQIVGFSNEKA